MSYTWLTTHFSFLIWIASKELKVLEHNLILLLVNEAKSFTVCTFHVCFICLSIDMEHHLWNIYFLYDFDKKCQWITACEILVPWHDNLEVPVYSPVYSIFNIFWNFIFVEKKLRNNRNVCLIYCLFLFLKTG